MKSNDGREAQPEDKKKIMKKRMEQKSKQGGKVKAGKRTENTKKKKGEPERLGRKLE